MFFTVQKSTAAATSTNVNPKILKLVVEPSGAVAVAALLQKKDARWVGQRVGVVLSGGNVDLSALPW